MKIERAQGVVDRCSDKTPDGRYLVVIKDGRKVFSGYATRPFLPGMTAVIENGVVQ